MLHYFHVIVPILVALIVANTAGQVGVRAMQPPLFTLSRHCQHVSVFLGNHESPSLPVGKQFCEGGNHSHSVCVLRVSWEEERG